MEKFTADMMPPRPMIRPIRPNMPRGRAPRGITPARPQADPQQSSVRPRATLPSAVRKPRAQS